MADQLNKSDLNIVDIKSVRASNNVFNHEFISKVNFDDQSLYLAAKAKIDNIQEEIRSIQNSPEYKSYPPITYSSTGLMARYAELQQYYSKYPLAKQLSDYQNLLSSALNDMQSAPTYHGTIEVYRNSKDCEKRKKQLDSMTYSSNHPIILVSKNILIEFDSQIPDKDKFIDEFNKIYNQLG